MRSIPFAYVLEYPGRQPHHGGGVVDAIRADIVGTHGAEPETRHQGACTLLALHIRHTSYIVLALLQQQPHAK